MSLLGEIQRMMQHHHINTVTGHRQFFAERNRMRTPCTPGRSEHDSVSYRTVGDERKLLMTANLENVIAKQPADQLISDGFFSGPYRLPEWRAKPVSDSISEIIRVVIAMYGRRRVSCLEKIFIKETAR